MKWGGLIMSDYHHQRHDGFGFAMILVLFILLVIIGAVFYKGYGDDYC